MCEVTREIKITLVETDTEYQARIDDEGCITSHHVYIKDVPEDNDALLIFLADALGYEPANVLNLEVFEEDEEAYK